MNELDNIRTLRHWFAGMAMQGLLASETPDWQSRPARTAQSAYEIADAMLEYWKQRKIEAGE